MKEAGPQSQETNINFQDVAVVVVVGLPTLIVALDKWYEYAANNEVGGWMVLGGGVGIVIVDSVLATGAAYASNRFRNRRRDN